MNIKFPLAWLKILTTTITKNCSETRIKFLFHLSFALIGRFLNCLFIGSFRNNFHFHRRFSEQFRVIGVCQEVRKSSLKRVTGRIFITISKWLHRSKQKLYLEFSSLKESQKLWKHSSYIQKVPCFWDPQKNNKILHLVTLLLEIKLIIVFFMGVARSPPPFVHIHDLCRGLFLIFFHVPATFPLSPPVLVLMKCGGGNKEPFFVLAQRSVFLWCIYQFL
jgi:hypothetical protein